MLGVCVLGIGLFLGSWMVQIVQGIGVSGLNSPVGWGVYITTFVFWVGIAHSGTLISGNYIHDISGKGIFLGYTDSTGIEISGNTIDGAVGAIYLVYNVLIENLVLQDNTITSPSGAAIQLHDMDGVDITGQDVTGLSTWWAVYVQDSQDVDLLGGNVSGNVGGIAFVNVSDGLIACNTIHGNAGAGINISSPADTIRVKFNSIVGNASGVENWSGSVLDASLNWWGSADGPWTPTNPTAHGEVIWFTNVIYSPWLGIDPDGYPAIVGVQLVSPLLFVVDDIGPAPAGGYFDAAVEGANEIPGVDTILVMPGGYTMGEPVGEGVEIIGSGECPTCTDLTGVLPLLSGGVTLGGFRKGFNLLGDVTVSGDASTVHINWNNIGGMISNLGTGTLDATFNYWGDLFPSDSITGDVAYSPFLPVEVCTLIGYMDEHGLSALDAIDYAYLLLQSHSPLASRCALLALEIRDTFGLTLDEVLALQDEYGCLRVNVAYRRAHGDYRDFLTLLLGYTPSMPFLDREVVGAGGEIEGVEVNAVYTQGETIHIAFTLTSPVSGEEIDDAVATLTVVRHEDDGVLNVLELHMIPFDEAAGQYVLDFDSSGLAPGLYSLWIGTSDGQSYEVMVGITAP